MEVLTLKKRKLSTQICLAFLTGQFCSLFLLQYAAYFILVLGDTFRACRRVTAWVAIPRNINVWKQQGKTGLCEYLAGFLFIYIILCFWCEVVCFWGGDGSVSHPHWATCQGPFKAFVLLDSGRKAAERPSDENLGGVGGWGGAGSMWRWVSKAGGSLGRKIKKAIRLVCGGWLCCSTGGEDSRNPSVGILSDQQQMEGWESLSQFQYSSTTWNCKNDILL